MLPPLLIRGRKKFHIRTYVAVVEEPYNPNLLEIYVYNRHEIRVAGVPVADPSSAAGGRDPLAHITNGAMSDATDRALLHEEPELAERKLQDKVEVFVAEAFARHLLPDIARRVSYSLKGEANDEGALQVKKFTVAGLDLMVTEDDRVFLLEANLYPSAPSETSVNANFAQHLKGFFHDLVELVVGNPSPNFLPAGDILRQHGLGDDDD